MHTSAMEHCKGYSAVCGALNSPSLSLHVFCSVERSILTSDCAALSRAQIVFLSRAIRTGVGTYLSGLRRDAGRLWKSPPLLLSGLQSTVTARTQAPAGMSGQGQPPLMWRLSLSHWQHAVSGRADQTLLHTTIRKLTRHPMRVRLVLDVPKHLK